MVPQMRNIYTMLKLPTLVYVLQVGRPLPVPQCSVKLLSMLIGFCTCKVRNILTLISLFSVSRWLMELQVSTVLPLSFQQVGFYFCHKQKHGLASERASERRSRVRGRGPFFRGPRTRVSFRVRLSSDFSRLSQMESLLAGISQAFIYSSSSSFKQTVVYLCSI